MSKAQWLSIKSKGADTTEGSLLQYAVDCTIWWRECRCCCCNRGCHHQGECGGEDTQRDVRRPLCKIMVSRTWLLCSVLEFVFRAKTGGDQQISFAWCDREGNKLLSCGLLVNGGFLSSFLCCSSSLLQTMKVPSSVPKRNKGGGTKPNI